MAYRERISSKSSALQPDTSISDSFRQNGERFRIDTPEKKLLVAIIERAIKDLILFRSQKRKKTPTWRDSCHNNLTTEFQLAYFQSESRGKWSLYWILEHIANDPKAEIVRLRNIAHSIVESKNLPNSFIYIACRKNLRGI